MCATRARRKKASRRDGAPDSLVDLRTQENTYAQQRQNIDQTFDLQKRSVRAETDREDTEQQGEDGRRDVGPSPEDDNGV